MKQKKPTRFAGRVAAIVVDYGGDMAFEHPRGSDLWMDRDMMETLSADYQVKLDMCSYELRARSAF